MPILRLYFLGPLVTRYDERQLPVPPTLKSQSLLAYLVLHRDQPQPRERLATLLWGDRPERRARHSLSTALWHIRRCLPDDDLVLSDPHTVQFDPQADLWLDVEAFEIQASQDDVASLRSAVALYRGDLLDGFYDDWIINERYRLETLFSMVLARLMVGREREGEHEAALSTALRLLDHDPLREDAHRVAMRAYCRLGQSNAALGQYYRCREIMLEELGAEPMVETTELYRAILEGRVAVGRAPEPLPVQMPTVAPSVPPGRSPLDVIAPSRLVGREQELAFLRECWQEATSRAGRGAEAGRGAGVLISGEAGVGKTRLVEEFASHLRWQGVRVLWGRCYEFERVLPYQPIAEALRTILPTLASAELSDFPAWAVGEMARLVPEVLEEWAGLEVTPAIRSDQERARLFDGVTRFLAELSSHGALLIVLEDLHWASESALQLVHYLARHLTDHQLLIVGTFRPEAIGLQHPLLGLRRRLTREGLAKPLRLSRLSPVAVEAMMVEMSGMGEKVVPLAARLYQETEGNPFFLMEIVKALFEAGAIHLEGGTWQGNLARISEGTLPLPTGVSEVIQARARRLDNDAQEALRLAAVLGREFDFDLLNAVWGRGKETMLEALDDLLRHRLLDEGTGPMGRDYRFTHHKIQEAVYGEIPCRRRQYTHMQAGAAIEQLYGSQAEEFVSELAFHFEQGRQLDQALTEKAITYLLQAGDQARGLYACQEAIDYYQRALALLKEQKQHERAARALMKVGLTYHNAFDFRQARRAYEEGFALWQRAGETQPAVPPPPAPHALRVHLVGSPLTLDPTVTRDSTSSIVVDQLFSGLVADSPEMEVVPDVAQSWEVLEDGRKYVFHLQDDVCWSDGAPVTARDFEYAWKRVLDPATDSPAASLLYDVKGARALHRGEVSDPNRVRVRALDDVTLLVELERPTGSFLQLLVTTATYPVPRHIVEAHGDAWAEVGNIVTNGPFRLKVWQRGEYMVLVRNPGYRGQIRGNVQQIELSLLADPSAQLEMYDADDLDISDLSWWGLPPPEIERARHRHAGEHISAPFLATEYVRFDVSRPPFDDMRVRRAFALATDRDTLADVALGGCVYPATGGFIPLGMPGHSPGIGLPYKPDQARRLLAQAGYPGGFGFPFVNSVTAPDLIPVSEYLHTQWQENLGVEITWEKPEWATFLDRLDKEPPQMVLIGWLADYPDPDSVLRAGVSYAWRFTRWRSEAFNRLVERARKVMNQEERMKLYQQADRILVEEAAIVPLLYQRQHLLVKPWVRNCIRSATGRRFWKDVIIEPH
jgi:ABC-type oligopeptide transport system substrate-binding subunit/DNA-binding SARP family transcriptional activator